MLFGLESIENGKYRRVRVPKDIARMIAHLRKEGMKAWSEAKGSRRVLFHPGAIYANSKAEYWGDGINPLHFSPVGNLAPSVSPIRVADNSAMTLAYNGVCMQRTALGLPVTNPLLFGSFGTNPVATFPMMSLGVACHV